MFRMLGNKVELIRYVIVWSGLGRKMSEGCVSTAHKVEVEQRLIERGLNFTVQTVNQPDNEWFNGLEFDSYDEAAAALQAGEAAYQQQQAAQQTVDSLRLRADIDYIAIMTGVMIE